MESGSNYDMLRKKEEEKARELRYTMQASTFIPKIHAPYNFISLRHTISFFNTGS